MAKIVPNRVNFVLLPIQGKSTCKKIGLIKGYPRKRGWKSRLSVELKKKVLQSNLSPDLGPLFKSGSICLDKFPTRVIRISMKIIFFLFLFI